MNLFTKGIFTHKRIILIFLLAIFIPSLIAAYLIISTFPKRREAVKNFLESNLWISGEAALRSVEGSIIDYEKQVLEPVNFHLLINPEKQFKTDSVRTTFFRDSAGKFFLLNPEYGIVYPKKATDTNPGFQLENEIPKSRFGEILARAENFEYILKDYSGAAELYKKCITYTSSNQLRAFALEGMGRCLLSAGKYNEASEVYDDLLKNYGQIRNKAGHPYGIIAELQLSEIKRLSKNEETSLRILLSLYEKIREGNWLIDQPVYDFYVSEIESVLNDNTILGNYPDLKESYSTMVNQNSKYGENLKDIDFIERNVVPIIKDRVLRHQDNNEVYTDHFTLSTDTDSYLISYSSLSYFISGQTFYGGICWNLNYLKNHLIEKTLENISRDSGLDFRLIDEGSQKIVPGENYQRSEGSLILPFYNLPLNWSLLVSHPEIKAIERSSRRDILVYGILIAVIVTLMLFGAIMIARDISRESETNRLKTEFVSNISHELKTPLTLIRLYGETLQRKKDLTDREKGECYEIITKESERLSHLINNVLDFSRIDMGRKEFDLKKGFMQDVIRDTLESYKYHLEKKGFVIHSDIARDLPEMNFDDEAIASVLVNLLSNAMKFSPQKKEVTVKLFRDNDNVVLQVADKGIGIAPGEVSKIYSRFYRSENKTVSETRGSGLGLTLVKHIVEAHGGRIEVESEVSKGSTFKVILPMNDIDNDL